MSRPRFFSTSGASLLRGLAACAALLCLGAGGASGTEDALAAQRVEFQQAMVRLGDVTEVEVEDSATLQRYPLYPYLQSARWQQELVKAGTMVPDTLDQQIGAFLRDREREPVAQGLRRAWLQSLATRGRWQDFLAYHQPTGDDLALRCLGFTARIETGRTEGLAGQIAQAWLTPRSLQDCDRAFTWLADNGALTRALIEQRARRALEGGNADFSRQIAARLPAEQAAPLLQWAALLESPQREVDALIANPRRAVEPAALRAGWMKLARADRDAARQRLDRLIRARRLGPGEASPLVLSLALTLAWDRDADALKYFARAQAADFDDTAREWQARAALWAGEWRQAARSIAAMSETNRRTARWRYWSARIAAAQGHQSTAQQLYESLLAEDNYYSAMAAARLKRPIAPNPKPLEADAALLASFETQPAFVRARELRLQGMPDAARAEWRAAQEAQPAPARPQAIHLAARWGWYQQAVTLATGERVFNDYLLLYPRPFDAEVTSAAQFSGLAPELIYGVIRQESLFEPDAVSSANARGLMQLTLDTARRTARNWKLPAPTATDLFKPALNVTLGAAHVKELLDRYGGQLPLALAGYNAGPGAVERWLPDDEMDPDIWIENIPYNETRNYVQRIPWHVVVFQWLRTGEAQDTQGWLRPVRP